MNKNQITCHHSSYRPSKCHKELVLGNNIQEILFTKRPGGGEQKKNTGSIMDYDTSVMHKSDS